MWCHNNLFKPHILHIDLRKVIGKELGVVTVAMVDRNIHHLYQARLYLLSYGKRALNLSVCSRVDAVLEKSGTELAFCAVLLAFR